MYEFIFRNVYKNQSEKKSENRFFLNSEIDPNSSNLNLGFDGY